MLLVFFIEIIFFLFCTYQTGGRQHGKVWDQSPVYQLQGKVAGSYFRCKRKSGTMTIHEMKDKKTPKQPYLPSAWHAWTALYFDIWFHIYLSIINKYLSKEKWVFVSLRFVSSLSGSTSKVIYKLYPIFLLLPDQFIHWTWHGFRKVPWRLVVAGGALSGLRSNAFRFLIY